MSTVANGLSIPDLSRSPTVDQVGVEERVERLTKRSIKKESKVLALKLALSMIDLTTLEGADSPGKVRQMCYKAAHLHDSLPDLPHVAAVCVYPTLVRLAKESLRGTNIHVAAVATGFPSGQYPLNVKLDDTRYAVGEGADEIDMVISRGHFLAGDYNYVRRPEPEIGVWFNHFRRVSDVKYYGDWVTNAHDWQPLTMTDTISILNDPHSQSYRLIQSWP